MRYKVYISRKAEKKRQKLSDNIRRRIDILLRTLEENPNSCDIVKMKGMNLFRVRSGKLRIIYSITDKREMLIENIEYRGRVYKG